MVEKFQSMPAIDEAITEKGYEYFLMILGDTPIGYMGVAPDDGALLLSKLYLMKPFRGQRRSNLFFDKAEEVAKEKGFTKVRLFVNRHNYDSVRVYLRKGFRIVDEVKTDIGEGFICDDFLMEKDLSEEG